MNTTETGPTEIMACPFCGGDDVVVLDAEPSGQMSEYSLAHCADCLTNGPLKSSDSAAIAAWNTRPLRNAQSEAVAAKATAWEGHWAGCGSVSSETSYTGSKALMERWERDGARIRPLYTHPAPQSEAVAVKALEWVKHPEANIWRVFSLLGTHHLIAIKQKPAWTFDGNDGSRAEGICETVDEAKAAAQADFDARIRSALTHPAPPLAVNDAARDVLAERRRQVEAEGWTPEHDDKHGGGQMAHAAACYALGADDPEFSSEGVFDRFWPWAYAWWKPAARRRNLVKAGALIIAEIDRLDRAAALTAALEAKQ